LGYGITNGKCVFDIPFKKSNLRLHARQGPRIAPPAPKHRQLHIGLA
jgi:hypothetical protein